MSKSGDIYTVHEKTDAAEPSDRIVLVREGFAFWAFVLTIFWLVAHQCWRMALGYLIFMVAMDRAAAHLGLSPLAVGALQLGMQFWLGCVAHDAQRAMLARKGYREIEVVCAESALLAERRFFDRQLAQA